MNIGFRFLQLASFIAFTTISCRNASTGSSGSISNANDSMTNSIPKHLQTDIAKKTKVDEEAKLGLKSIENGFDGIQIRVYQSYDPLDQYLFLLKQQNQVWSGEFYHMHYILAQGGEMDSSVIIKSPLGNPDSGWENLLKNLEKYHIFSIPDYSTIPGYSLNTDEGGVLIEVAQKDKYRISYYPDPNYRKNTYLEAKNVIEILRLLHAEFRKD